MSNQLVTREWTGRIKSASDFSNEKEWSDLQLVLIIKVQAKTQILHFLR